MYIRVSTSIITFTIRYFLFIVFNKVFSIIPFMEFPLKWEIQNNIMMYITISYEGSYIIRNCIQLYSKVKYSSLLRPQNEHRKLTMMTT